MFDSTFFAQQLRREVENLAQEHYGGDLSKGFAYWAIRQLSQSLSDDEVEFARSICEDHGPGDEGIDGAWIEGLTGPLLIIQAKWVNSIGVEEGPEVQEYTEEDDGDQELSLKNFGRKPAQELWSAFRKISLRAKSQGQGPRASQKLLAVSVLYNKALKENRQVRLLVVLAGKYGKQLRQEVDAVNQELRGSPDFHGHYMDVYDFMRLSELYSERIYPPPKPVFLRYLSKMMVPGSPATSDSPYALALTVSARELVRIRHDNGLNIYHSNFRFVIKSSPIRKQMFSTLENVRERRNFWRYNNGITIVCRKVREAPGGLDIDGFQVVNGLQTIEVLHDFAGQTKEEGWMDDVLLQVRLVPTLGAEAAQEGPSLEERIAEYSNSQNPIKPRDLRSNDAIQKELAADMASFGLRYQRKVGMYRKAYDVVDNVRAAQLALSFWRGRPRAAKNAKRLIFVFKHDGGYYEDIFLQGYTKAPWLLVPYFFFDNYERWINSTTGLGSLADYGNFLVLSIVGNAFTQLFPYETPNSVDERGYDRLKVAFGKLTDFRDSERLLKEVWRPAFDTVEGVVKEAQLKPQVPEGGSPPTERSIAVKLDFSDLKPAIKQTDSAKLPERLSRLFGVA